MSLRRTASPARRSPRRTVTAAAASLAAVAAALPTAAVVAGPAQHPTARAAAPVPGTAGQRETVPGMFLVVHKDATTVGPGHVSATVQSRRKAALGRIASAVGARPTAETTAALPTFTARLSPGQVRTLERRSDVLAVRPVTIRRLTTGTSSTWAQASTASTGTSGTTGTRRTTAFRTPEFLGLTGTGVGSWASYGGTAAAGRGTVIGFVDSGVWPEAPTFTTGVGALGTTATTTVGTAYRTSATGTAVRKADGGLFHGDCGGATSGATTQGWTAALCNQALVSARAFPPASGWVNPGPTDTRGREYASPRDGLGHGTHTASTAVGRTVPISYPGVPAGSTSTGVAPGASLAVYKACWTSKVDTDSDGAWDNFCSDDSLVAAVDQAVKDGVDVINMSISGTTDDPLDPVDLALLGAARAGIVPVASAGNDGPGAGTVNHPSPWITTVGATTWYPPIVVDDYSGRGPSSAVAGAFLKPDLVAPGTDILAAVPPAIGQAATTPTVDLMSGTSMATPHVSGLAAILLGAHPVWSPMMVRSALAGRATPVPGATAVEQGSGVATARGMASADLLMDATPADYQNVLGWVSGSPTGLNPADLNQPNVVLGDVAAHRTTRRTFVAQRAGAWVVAASVPGYRVAVSPRRGIARYPGQRITVTMTATRTTAPTGSFAEGALTLDGGRGLTRLPFLARTY